MKYHMLQIQCDIFYCIFLSLLQSLKNEVFEFEFCVCLSVSLTLCLCLSVSNLSISIISANGIMSS